MHKYKKAWRNDYNSVPPLNMSNPPIYDYDTDNRSFANISNILRELGVKNHSFMLLLMDPGLQYVDPFAGDLTDELKERITIEAFRNPMYTLRELTRVMVDGGILRFELHLGNCAIVYLLYNDVSFYVEMPRQLYKTTTVMQCYAHIFNFGGRTNMMLTHHIHQDAKLNLKRVIQTIKLYPEYLNFLQEYDARGKAKKISDTKEHYIHPKTESFLFTVASANSVEDAKKKGRGKTFPIGNFDEYGYIKFIKDFVSSAQGAFTTATTNAKANGMRYGMHITSTAPDPNSDSGKSAHIMVTEAVKFSNIMYDMTKEELHEYIYRGSQNNIVYCSFDWRMLGLTKEWLEDKRRRLSQDPIEFRRDYLNEWILDMTGNPIPEDKLKMIKIACDNTEYHEHLIDKKWLFIYHNMTHEEFMDNPKYKEMFSYGVSIDFAGVGKDSCSVKVIDRENFNIICEFSSPRIGTEDFSDLLIYLMYNIFNKGLYIPERNAYGDPYISKVTTKHPKLTKLLYFQYLKDNTKKSDKKGTFRYGLWSAKKIREGIYEEVLFMVENFPQLITSKEMYEQMKTLIYGKGGRIDHAPGYHDDSIISYGIGIFTFKNTLAEIDNITYLEERVSLEDEVVELRLKSISKEEIYKANEEKLKGSKFVLDTIVDTNEMSSKTDTEILFEYLGRVKDPYELTDKLLLGIDKGLITMGQIPELLLQRSHLYNPLLENKKDETPSFFDTNINHNNYETEISPYGEDDDLNDGFYDI